MMRRVLSYLRTPEKDDPAGCPIHSWQATDQPFSLQAQAEQIIAGNLTTADLDMKYNDTLTDVTSEAC